MIIIFANLTAYLKYCLKNTAIIVTIVGYCANTGPVRHSLLTDRPCLAVMRTGGP